MLHPFFYKNQLRWFELKWIPPHRRFRKGRYEWVSGHFRKIWRTYDGFSI